MINNLEKGKIGELLVGKYLIKQGYKIICYNYNSRYGEIDIVSENDDYIIFTEVKTRKNLKFSYPIEAVNKNKRIKIIKTAFNYISKTIITKQPRFDIAEVIINFEETFKIFYHENIFDAEEYNAFF